MENRSMLIEFSGPPASGKTSVATMLRDRGFIPVRTQGNLLKKTRLVSSCIVSAVFLRVFIKNLIILNIQFGGVKNRSRLFFIAFLGAMSEKLRNKCGYYIKDQGFLQLGDWVSPNIADKPEKLAIMLKNISGQPDVAVFFSLPPSLSVKKLASRGDLNIWQERAVMRGFCTAEERFAHQQSKEWIKIELCRRLNIPCIVVKINKGGVIDDILKVADGEALDDERMKVVNNLALEIRDGWKNEMKGV